MTKKKPALNKWDKTSVMMMVMEGPNLRCLKTYVIRSCLISLLFIPTEPSKIESSKNDAKVLNFHKFKRISLYFSIVGRR